MQIIYGQTKGVPGYRIERVHMALGQFTLEDAEILLPIFSSRVPSIAPANDETKKGDDKAPSTS